MMKQANWVVMTVQHWWSMVDLELLACVLTLHPHLSCMHLCGCTADRAEVVYQSIH